MVSPLHFLMLFLTFAGVFDFAYAEMKFDVKTKVAEKAKLKTIKQGVLSCINSTSWGRTTEVGEDYAIWLVDFQRNKDGSKITAIVSVELRKPKMLGMGNLIDKRDTAITYSEDTLKGIESQDFNELFRLIHEELNYTGTTQKLLNSAKQSTVVMASNQLPGSEIFLGGLVDSLTQELDRKPSKEETWEATILGAQILILLVEMLQRK